MNPKQEILQVLFNDYFFAASDNKLAALLGYASNSRSTIGRIKRGEKVSAEKVDEIWDKLRETFFIGDDEIALAAEWAMYGHNLWQELQAELGAGICRHSQAFTALLAEEYDAISPRFGNELSAHLHEMRLQSPALYYGMLAYCYVLCEGLSFYTAAGAKNLPGQLYAVNDMLFEAFPANSRARQAAEKIISFDLEQGSSTLYSLIVNLQVIFGNYADEDYFENILREKGHLLDVGDDSFWVAPGAAFAAGCELWYFSVVMTKSKLHGSYIAMRLRAANASPSSFELVESYNLMFLVANDKEATQVLQIYDIPTGRIGYAVYGYDYDTGLLTLSFDDSAPNIFGLPCELQCVDRERPQGAAEKVWANITGKMVESGDCRTLLLSAVNSSCESDFEYLAEYDVANVAIDRRALVITVERDGVDLRYSLQLTAYPFLAKISPMEFVSVARSKSCGELFFSWNDLGQFIPFSEFELL